MTGSGDNSGIDASLREHIADQLRRGHTVDLAAAALFDPDVRGKLPGLIEALQRELPQAATVRIHGYQVLGEIARGGMSTVYLARHQLLGRHVALKLVPVAPSSQDRSRERALREARAMAKITHPNIVSVHEVVDAGDTFALAMEWIDGLTLAQLLAELPRREQPDDLQRIAALLGGRSRLAGERDLSPMRWFVRTIRDVALAVQHVHDAGLLHLDIKPSNLLVRRDGTPLLADFGVVREIDLSATQTRTFAGTPIYAAPEQFQVHDGKLTAATDVYGLGITLYEALARARPLEDTSLSKMLRDLEVGSVPRLSSRCLVPLDVENVVHKAIDPDPRRRYASAGAFAADLTAFLEGRPVSARPWTLLERIRRWRRREPWKALAVAAIVVLAPIAGGLTVKLLADLPELRRLEQAQRRKAALTIVHDTLQNSTDPSSMSTLWNSGFDEADALAPGDPVVLVCRVIIEGGLDFAAAVRRLEASPELPRRLALQMLAGRLRERRLCFDHDEQQRLLASRDTLDHIAVILDRLPWMRLVPSDRHARQLLDWIDRARLTTREVDPLLLGVRAAVAALARDSDQLRVSVQAIETLWPNDPEMLCWAGRALEIEAGPQPDYWLALQRRFPRSVEILANMNASLVHAGRFDEATHWLAEGDAEGRLRIEFARSTTDRGKVAAEILADTSVDPDYRAAIATMVGSPLAAGLAATTLDHDVPLPTTLKVLATAKDPAVRPIVEAALHRLLDGKPPAWAAMSIIRSFYGPDQSVTNAAAAIGKLQDPQEMTGDQLWYGSYILSQAQDWENLLRFATLQLAAPDSPRDGEPARFYLAIAHMRLGDDAAGIDLLRRYIAAAGDKVYVEALQERARYLCQPNTPPEARDPAAALAECDDIDRILAKKRVGRSPWFGAIRAEAEFANGNLQAAIDLTEAALVTLRTPLPPGSKPPMGRWSAPKDLEARLVAANARYRAAATAAADAAGK